MFFPCSLAPPYRGHKEEMQGFDTRTVESGQHALGKWNVLSQSSVSVKRWRLQTWQKCWDGSADGSFICHTLQKKFVYPPWSLLWEPPSSFKDHLTDCNVLKWIMVQLSQLSSQEISTIILLNTHTIATPTIPCLLLQCVHKSSTTVVGWNNSRLKRRK